MEETNQNKHFFVSFIYFIIGLGLLLMLLVTVVPFFSSRIAEQDVKIHISSEGSTSQDDKFKLLIHEMSDSKLQHIEERLRDHFTLLLAISGLTTTIILAGFSYSQAKREDKLISAMQEKLHEAENLVVMAKSELKEIQNCKNQAINDLEISARSKRNSVLKDKKTMAKDSFAQEMLPMFENKSENFKL